MGMRLLLCASFCALLLACGTSGPTDQLVEEQVHEWLDSWWCPETLKPDGPRIEFSDYFDLRSWKIVDRLVEGTNATVIVELTVVTRDHSTRSSMAAYHRDQCFSMITGGERMKPGNVFVWTAKALFQKFESGWRLDEWQEGSQSLLSTAEVERLERDE